MNEVTLDNNLDCLLLTETWLGTDASVILTEASPPNFNFLFSIREGRRGGGTASFIRNSLTSNRDSYTSFEHHTFTFGSPPILCITEYRLPYHCSSFISELQKF